MTEAEGIPAEEELQIRDVEEEAVVVAEEIELLQSHLELLSKDRSFSFINRLCRENNWDSKFAQECINEYVKFLYLIIKSKQELTPSDEVDQVWHLHLQYSRSYQKMCDEIGYFIHHEPTKGGENQKNKFTQQYEKTKQIYFQMLGVVPPRHIWDNSTSRFQIKPQSARINLYYNYVINKSLLTQSLIASVLIVTGIALMIM